MNPTSTSISQRPAYRRIAALGLLLVLVAAPAVPAQAAPPAVDNSAAAAGSAVASSGAATAGRRGQARTQTTPPTLTDRQAATRREQAADRAPVDKGAIASLPRAKALNPPITAPGAPSTLATTILRDSAIPASGISGGSSFVSNTQEPSTDANGGNIFQTGNWYATRSTNNGATWSALDPFTIFGSGFCCDQVTQYDPIRGRQFWLLQYSDHLVLANASAAGAGAFTSWCWYTITPSWFGQPSTTSIDYNDMTIGNNYVYISSNLFPSGGGSASGIIRLPAAAMSTCGGFSYNYLTRTDNFTFKLTPGSTDTLFWGSNWGQTNGSSFRVFAWAESSTSYSWWDRTVASYGFFTRNSGQNCASANGVVTNWCAFADSRTLGAYRAAGVLGFSFNARQDGSHPFPYTRIVWFNESTKAYLGAGDVWGSWGAIQFMSLAPNNAGRVGGVFAWGGGTGTTAYYPGGAAYTTGATTIENNSNFFLWGQGNTCTAAGGIPRFGDYLTARTYKANPSTWIAAAYAFKGGNCGSPGVYSEPHNINFSG
ncbi:hypothetical protein ACGFI9_36715 [Micromonospora sp. NPDC048930]|uniref:hypothetical protein n=1 Tax=Micromonospora sp. NPDC048930 TaxID=3364261 RepID=UPI00371ECB0F